MVSLQCIRSSRWQPQLKTAVWRKPGGHGEDDPVRQRASGPQRAALPPIRQERRSQKDAAGRSDEGIEEGRVLWWYCAILTHQFVVFYIKYWWSGLFKHAIIFWAYKLICSTLLPLVCCWCKYTVEVETWLALWVAVHLHPLCPLANVFVYVCLFRMHSVCWHTQTPGTAPWASSWTPCKERRSAPLSTVLFWVRLRSHTTTFCEHDRLCRPFNLHVAAVTWDW